MILVGNIRSWLLVIFLIKIFCATQIEGTCNELIFQYDCLILSEAVVLVNQKKIFLSKESQEVAKCICFELKCFELNCENLFDKENENLVSDKLNSNILKSIKKSKIENFKKQAKRISIKIIVIVSLILFIKNVIILCLMISC